MSRVKWIIGVDCSLRNCGVSIIDNVGNNVADFNLTTKNGMTDHDSVDMMVQKFFEDPRLEPCFAKPDGVSLSRFYFELIYFGKMGKATARAEVIGAIKWNLRQDGHPIYGVEPNALNSFFAAKHFFKYPNRKSADIKVTTMRILHEKENFYTKNDNIADARVAARYGYAHTFEKKRLSPTALSRLI